MDQLYKGTERQEDYSKYILAMPKVYKDEQKYTGDLRDSFDKKFEIFTDYVRSLSVPIEAITAVFPYMLRGPALDFYHRGIKPDNLHTWATC